MEFMTDWETFMLDYSDEKIFQVNVLKRKFTPFEEAEKFSDEDIWEEHGYFKFMSSIELPDKDILIGMLEVIEDPEDYTYYYTKRGIDYYKLSEIRFVDVTERFKKEYNNGYKDPDETDYEEE